MDKKKNPIQNPGVDTDVDDEETAQFFMDPAVASSTDCTGLVPAAVSDEEMAEAYDSMYYIHKQKAQHKEPDDEKRQ